MIVAVQVGRFDLVGMGLADWHAQLSGRCKRPVAVADQQPDLVRVMVANCRVKLPVFVEIADRQPAGTVPDPDQLWTSALEITALAEKYAHLPAYAGQHGQ